MTQKEKLTIEQLQGYRSACIAKIGDLAELLEWLNDYKNGTAKDFAIKAIQGDIKNLENTIKQYDERIAAMQ